MSGGVLALIRSGMHPAEAVDISRNDAIVLIRQALRERSGKPWSVTGGRGTAWGWITVTSPPRRRENGSLSESDRVELAALLGRDDVHQQGASIADTSDYRCEYVTRALGLPVLNTGKPYWD